jgi:hypothetical protein
MRKVYGEYRQESCPYCGKQALATNGQGIPVCKEHIDKELNLKCACGEWLDVKKGKFGAFFLCMSCGPVSMRKALDMNSHLLKDMEKPASVSVVAPIKDSRIEKKKEITVRSDELDFL